MVYSSMGKLYAQFTHILLTVYPEAPPFLPNQDLYLFGIKSVQYLYQISKVFLPFHF